MTMKLRLDENLPHRLRPLIVGHDVFTVTYFTIAGQDVFSTPASTSKMT